MNWTVRDDETRLFDDCLAWFSAIYSRQTGSALSAWRVSLNRKESIALVDCNIRHVVVRRMINYNLHWLHISHGCQSGISYNRQPAVHAVQCPPHEYRPFCLYSSTDVSLTRRNECRRSYRRLMWLSCLSANSITSICCRFVYNKLYKSTTNTQRIA